MDIDRRVGDDDPLKVKYAAELPLSHKLSRPLSRHFGIQKLVLGHYRSHSLALSPWVHCSSSHPLSAF